MKECHVAVKPNKNAKQVMNQIMINYYPSCSSKNIPLLLNQLRFEEFLKSTFAIIREWKPGKSLNDVHSFINFNC